MKPIVIGVLTCLLSFAANAPLAVRYDEDSMTLNLRVAPARVCSSGMIKISLELRNNSNQPVVIDRTALLHRVTFYYVASPGSNAGSSFTEIGDSGGYHRASYFVLRPTKSYKATKTLKLTNQFFNKPGRYDVKVGYGQFVQDSFNGLSVWRGAINSNESSFDIAKCR
jgi:hypothetical protein